MKDQNQIQPTEKSLKYMSWSFKELIIEIKKLNETLEKISKNIDQKDPLS